MWLNLPLPCWSLSSDRHLEHRFELPSVCILALVWEKMPPSMVLEGWPGKVIWKSARTPPTPHLCAWRWSPQHTCSRWEPWPGVVRCKIHEEPKPLTCRKLQSPPPPCLRPWYSTVKGVSTSNAAASWGQNVRSWLKSWPALFWVMDCFLVPSLHLLLPPEPSRLKARLWPSRVRFAWQCAHS